MTDDQYRDDAPGDGEGEDDLLHTIRKMVQEESARAAPPAKEKFAAPFNESAGQPAQGDASGGGRLVLGAAARVDGDTPDRHAAGAPMYDEAALRPLVNEMVREELAELMGEALEHRIRTMVRRELRAFLDGDDDPSPTPTQAPGRGVLRAD